MRKKFLPNIGLCIFLDLMGFVSYLMPVIGEAEDLFWAPISAIIFYFLFGRKRFGVIGAVFSFLEQLSPGLDFIPAFTIAWFIRKKQLGKASEIKKIKSSINAKRVLQ